MGNKMKKLICALLASTNACRLSRRCRFADEDTNAETVVTTSAEATEKPADAEATEAPAECRDSNRGSCCNKRLLQLQLLLLHLVLSYDNDSYYDKALSLSLSALGIITGYEWQCKA